MKYRLFHSLLTTIGLLASFNATAKDVYVYSPAGDDLGHATEVKRIEFDKNGKLALVPETGENVNIDITRLGYIAFKPTESSGVSSLKSANATLHLVGDILSVTSASEINAIRIYDTLGEMTGQCVPAACEATLTVNTGGVNIVVVEAGGISQTYKIVR